MGEYDSTGSPLGLHQLVSIGPDQSQSANQNIELLELENGAVIAAWGGKRGTAEFFAKGRDRGSSTTTGACAVPHHLA